MTPFELYTKYIALKLHLTSSTYHFYKHSGKVKASLESFDARKDKPFFVKLAKQPKASQILLANLCQDPHKWIGEILTEEGLQIHKDWQKRRQSLSYCYEQEIKKLNPILQDLIVVKKGRHPELLQEHLAGTVSLETMCIILAITKALPYWNSKMKGDFFWAEMSMRVEKYQTFLKYTKSKMRALMLSHFRKPK
jgi:hypothetical protein